ncbi:MULTISPECIES: hypothetical protein [unclassified Streptomyces]|uniref:hypothetical protein n=1 Tax=unclassified Streptomyces TaxID=2593676 RepID=UPI002DD98F85|nr:MULTISPECIES: hypothetical protein [unclassified Streptomyces]WSA96610.1 hypothetical protein OIE63_37435 [Streptomyces sp. NBC_01795]WSB81024.1 hypothetical protein OHB04_38550 [Streptomyces sp. NBC_01775]WSS10765.1 hypothetical protein OG533_01705 [Streptomyces sp. NBC_01186]WSS39464.1 hypothetical protein OG220_01745 [Streptomyces sp. NBC_01187]
MGKGGWSLMQGLGLIVLVGFGQAVWRGLFDHGTRLLWGAFDWAPGGRNGQMTVIGAITLLGLLITLVATFGASRASRTRKQTLRAAR